MWRLCRTFTNFYKYSHEKVVVTCKDIASLKPDKLASFFGSKEVLSTFFESIPKQVRSMQTPDICKICASLSKISQVSELNPYFWKDIAEELVKRAQDYEISEIIDIVNIFSEVNTDKKIVKKVLDEVCKELEEFEWADFRALPLHQVEQLLANYSLKNLGSTMLYHILSETIMAHKDFHGLAYQHLAKLANYFSRANLAKRKSAKFVKTVEEILWNAIHQGKLKEMEEITGVITYIFPGNIGSNELRALLEFTLFRFLAEPKNQITISRLCQIITSFSHYIIAYRPLDLLLKQLVKDSLDSLSAKELIQIIWAYSRHNKADSEFITLLFKKSIEIIPASTLPFRHFTYLINSVVNTGEFFPEISELIDNFSLKAISTQVIQDHYLIKALSLVPNSSKFVQVGLKELMNNRIHKNHPTDLARSFVLLSEKEQLQTQPILDHFSAKIPEFLPNLRPSHISKIVYTLSKLNCAEPKYYRMLEKKILEHDLAKMTAIDLGVACLGFGLVGMPDFCGKALSAVNDCFHKYQHIEYEDFSDTDQEEHPNNKLILVNQQDLDFTSEIPASAVVQMAWMAASVGVDDPAFWNEKIIHKLKSVKLNPQPFSINQWIWTAKNLKDEEDYVLGVDHFHYALLTQTLDLVLKNHLGEEFKYNFATNTKEFVEDVEKYVKIAKKQYVIDNFEFVVDGKKVFLYENQHYVFRSNGYFKQNSETDLLTPVKLQKKISEAKGEQCVSIFKGDWIAYSPKEKQKKILELISP